ncbi:MAG: HAMP domain-containing histidine kinase [Bdellovibrionales bacterium]|nr:HAMP domain-containing histidine kinase [Bdellovibrionales bacterium]
MISSVRLKIISFVGIILIVFIYSSNILKNTYIKKSDIVESLRRSYQAESLALQLLLLPTNKTMVRNNIRDKLDYLGGYLIPQNRAAFVKDLIEATYNENQNLIRNRLDLFMKNELSFRKFQRVQLRFANESIQYFSVLSFFSILISIFVLLFYTQQNVFVPINILSKRMLDFLNNRYTYQFTIPTNSEVGNLHSTFNALAQRVLRNMEELTTLDHAKSEFLSIASHELRTPLTSIKGSLSLMKSGVTGPMNEMTQNLLNIAENETDRLIRLINELLDLAKIESGKFEVQQEWHSINEMVDRTLSSLHGLAQAAQVKLVKNNIPAIHIYMDKDRIQQVLTNLLSNAIKFSPVGGEVEVSTDINSKQHLIIKVKDHGRGIAPEDQEVIFQKFRQASSSRNPLVKGTGLGLAIAKALVEEHQGEIQVHSTPGNGSTFSFTLPQWQYSLEEAVSTSLTKAAA